MASVFFKMAEENAEYLNVKLKLIQALAPKSMQEKESNRIDKSVPRVTVWNHSAEPRDANSDPLNKSVCPIHKLMIYSYSTQLSLFSALRLQEKIPVTVH